MSHPITPKATVRAAVERALALDPTRNEAHAQAAAAQALGLPVEWVQACTQTEEAAA